MPQFPDDLYDVQQELLFAAAASLDYLLTIPDPPGPLKGAPARAYVAPPGDFVLDCEKLIVNAAGIGEQATGPGGASGSSGKRHATTGRITNPALRVIIGRECIPVGRVNGTTYTPPTIAEEQAASRQLNADGWALWNGIWTRLVDDDIDFMSRCSQVFWGGMIPVGPSGAYAGWILTLNVRLPGYLEPIGS
jgi:hypothetical protein